MIYIYIYLNFSVYSIHLLSTAIYYYRSTSTNESVTFRLARKNTTLILLTDGRFNSLSSYTYLAAVHLSVMSTLICKSHSKIGNGSGRRSKKKWRRPPSPSPAASRGASSVPCIPAVESPRVRSGSHAPTDPALAGCPAYKNHGALHSQGTID